MECIDPKSDAEDLRSIAEHDIVTRRLVVIPPPGADPAGAYIEGASRVLPESEPASHWAYDVPAHPTAIFGREEAIGAIANLLNQPSVRLVTVTGSGGIGKSRLAGEVAQRMADRFDAVAFVDLSTHAHDQSVVPTIFMALEGRSGGRAHVTDRSNSVPLRAIRPEQSTLLVLDNFERVAGAAPALASLLRVFPNLRVLVTSRILLKISWEHVHQLDPLPVPAIRNGTTLPQLIANPAFALFLERARSTNPEFRVADADMHVFADICAKLEGNPLEIALAAPYTAVLSPRQLRASLEQRLDFLTKGPRDLPPRQQGLRASLDWSYLLLTPADQRLARHFSIFAGGGTIDAAAAILPTSAQDSGTLVDGLVRLVEQSILRASASEEGDRRFCMSDAQRDYLLEQLKLDPEADEIARRHADYYLNLVEQRAIAERGAPSSAVMQGMQRDCDNIRAALEFAIDAESFATGLRIAIAVSQFWIACGHVSEGRRWIDRLLALDPAPASFDELRLHALSIAADLAIRQGDYAQAAEMLNAAADHCRDDTSSEACARVLAILGIARLRLGDYEDAAPLLAEGTQRLRAEGDPLHLARALRASASLAANLGELAEAVPLLSESQRRSAAADDSVGEAEALCGLGDVALLAGATAEARSSYQDALNVARRAGSAQAEAAALIGLGNAAASRDEAAEWRREALTNCLTQGNRYCVARVLEGVAQDASSHRTPGIAPERLLATATRLREQAGVAPDALESIVQIEHSPASERDAPFTRSGLNGPGHEVIDAVVHALSAQPASPAPKAWDTAPQPNDTLSRREREVVHYISEGLTNRQIAQLLGIAERTVDSHVSNALRKLELKSRASIAAWVVARRMNGNRGGSP